MPLSFAFLIRVFRLCILTSSDLSAVDPSDIVFIFLGVAVRAGKSFVSTVATYGLGELPFSSIMKGSP